MFCESDRDVSSNLHPVATQANGASSSSTPVNTSSPTTNRPKQSDQQGNTEHVPSSTKDTADNTLSSQHERSTSHQQRTHAVIDNGDDFDHSADGGNKDAHALHIMSWIAWCSCPGFHFHRGTSRNLSPDPCLSSILIRSEICSTMTPRLSTEAFYELLKKNSLQYVNKAKFSSNPNICTHNSFNTLIPTWFCGEMVCCVSITSTFSFSLQFECNSIHRNRKVRRRTPPCTANLQGIIAALNIRESAFIAPVINYFMQRCSSLPPLPSVSQNHTLTAKKTTTSPLSAEQNLVLHPTLFQHMPLSSHHAHLCYTMNHIVPLRQIKTPATSMIQADYRLVSRKTPTLHHPAQICSSDKKMLSFLPLFR